MWRLTRQGFPSPGPKKPGQVKGLYRDNGKENGNYYNGLYRDYRVILGLYEKYYLRVKGRQGACFSAAAFMT